MPDAECRMPKTKSACSSGNQLVSKLLLSNRTGNALSTRNLGSLETNVETAARVLARPERCGLRPFTREQRPWSFALYSSMSVLAVV